MADLTEAEPKEEQLLQLALEYITTGIHPAGISIKTRERELCTEKQVGTLVVGNDQYHQKKVKVVAEKKAQD